jgi:hypothetical protein
MSRKPEHLKAVFFNTAWPKKETEANGLQRDGSQAATMYGDEGRWDALPGMGGLG